MKSNDRSEKQIIISFTLVICLVVILAMVSIIKMTELSSLTQKFYNHPFAVATSAHIIQTHLVSMHRYMKDVVLSRNNDDLEMATKRVNKDEELIYKEFDLILERYLGDKQEISKTRDLFSDWKIIRQDVIGLMHKGKIAEAVKMNQTRAYEHVNTLSKRVNVFVDFAHNKAAVFSKDALETKQVSMTFVIVTAILILVFIITIMFILLQSLKKAEGIKRQQEEKLFQESRLAQMGEMISMIAHQWRQPLSSINATVSLLQVKQALGECDEQTYEEELKKITEYVQHLSGTINDFRTFYKPNKELTKTSLESVIVKSLRIIESSLTNLNIELIVESNSKEKVEVYENEIIQVILSILQNNKDHFIEKQTENPSIKITTDSHTISICDNGGGIPQDIINKIFDPYFSTKNEKNGTGLGLYMSKTIIEDHHNGTLQAYNIDNGACFKIQL